MSETILAGKVSDILATMMEGPSDSESVQAAVAQVELLSRAAERVQVMNQLRRILCEFIRSAGPSGMSKWDPFHKERFDHVLKMYERLVEHLV